MLLNGEKEWQKEYADIPSDVGRNVEQPTPTKSNGNGAAKGSGNLTEFSALLDDSTPIKESNTETSIGQYFLRNCESLRDMLPDSSPTKGRPIPLLSNSYRSGSAFSSI